MTVNRPLLTRTERDTASDGEDINTLSDDELPIDTEVKVRNDDSLDDPFRPFDDLPVENRNILTFRALLVGVLCGALVNASNIYLGLKSGWTASANIFAVSCPTIICSFSDI